MATIFSKDKNNEIKYIAFFDLDHTIIGTNSGKALIKYAYRHDLLNRMDLIRGFCYSLLYRFDLMDTTKIISNMVRWVEGYTENKLKSLSSDVFKDHIISSIHSEVITEINFHKNNGALVVILSSSISEICNIVADYLEMDDVLCSKLEVINGIYTGLPSGPFCFGEEKVARLIEYCKQNNLDPQKSWYYGDAAEDLPVLNSVENPVCINPDNKLKKTAEKRGWKILQWHLQSL